MSCAAFVSSGFRGRTICVSSAARADYAAAAAAVLTAAQPQAIYELAGDHGFTLTEYAAEVARQSGKAIVYKDLP